MSELENDLRKSILVVDDEPKNVQLLGNILKNENYRVEFALDGEEALDWLKNQPFDLILLDVMMPNLNGYEVCGRIRESEHLKEIPVIFLSALNETEDKIKAFDIGGNDYITKPFQAKEVIARIKNHLALQETKEQLKTAINEKEQSNLLLNTILKSVPETLITVDKKLNTLNINRKNNPICDLNKHKVDDLNQILKDASNACNQVITQTIKTKSPIREFKAQITNLSGVKKNVQLSTSPLLDKNEVFNGVLLVVRDTTRLSRLETRLNDRQGFRHIIGKSEPMQKIYTLLEQISDVDTNILINGESGTGKELIAEALHYGSNRAKGPFVKVNCAALSENLLESELFGHVKGAFTGAIDNRAGRFETANGGTIFLDEIGEISPQIQVKLLRVLEQKEFERLGDSKTIKVDVRVVAATNIDFKEKIAQKEFREDLYYRLKGMMVSLPPLRERKEDIPLLCEHFYREFNETLGRNVAGLSSPVLDLFLGYPWPGNIRELRHAMEHACVLCKEGDIGLEHLPIELFDEEKQDSQSPQFTYAPKLSKSQLLQALEESRWNKAKAAKTLGIGRNTLYRYMKKYHITSD